MPDLTNPTNLPTVATIAVVVGALVRLMKTEKMNTLLSSLPGGKRIPKSWLPWLSIGLGIAITMIDAKLNGKMASWADALLVGLAGVLAGGTAVAGHETVAKGIAGIKVKKNPPPGGSSGGPKDEEAIETPVVVSDTPQKRMLLPLLLAAVITSTTCLTGCAAVGAALPHVIAAIVDGGMIIDQIAAFVGRYFAEHPDPEKQRKVGNAIAKCRAALTIALHVAEGSDKLDKKKVDAAFDDFKKAYVELIELVRPYGVAMDGDPPTANPNGVSMTVPRPLALKGVRE